jgi:NADH-ubiquinone/plastoquinone oxidoreductase, chain 3
MIEIQCPRCEQYWYDKDDEEVGRVRLCSRCADELRLKRGHRAEIDISFLIIVGVFLVFDVTMLSLTAWKPAVFAKITTVVGFILIIVGGYVWRFLAGGWHNTDWRTGRWGWLMLLSGFALFGFSLARIAH